MRLTPSDPDIQTLVTRIKGGAIDLQPDFQRGFVWSEAKCKRLIDSILRDWHIPPIHLVRDENEDQVVLDGQQRLSAIRDFVLGRFPVDGHAEPRDPEMESLHGLRYEELPEKHRRRFDRFTIRVFTITDYLPEEPYELFYRLNESTVLTSSEKRNAFFGEARAQVKELVDFAIQHGLTKERIGFSNSRMAYDDAISRFCYALEVGSLRQKITSALVTDRYRSQDAFAPATLSRARQALATLLDLQSFDDPTLRLNKATFHSWLCFAAVLLRDDGDGARSPTLEHFVTLFEVSRALVKFSDSENTKISLLQSAIAPRQAEQLLRLFNDRASARVTDVSSVLLRDLILWIAYFAFADLIGPDRRPATKRIKLVASLIPSLHEATDVEHALARFVEEKAWGDEL